MDFVGPDNTNYVREWAAAELGPQEALLNNLLLWLGQIEENKRWSGRCDPLEGAPCTKRKLYELRFSDGSKECRVFGFFQPGHIFVMIAGCYHKGRRSGYKPRGIFKIACARYDLYKAGKGKIVKHTSNLDEDEDDQSGEVDGKQIYH